MTTTTPEVTGAGTPEPEDVRAELADPAPPIGATVGAEGTGSQATAASREDTP